MEEWKAIPGYEYYQISSLGRIKTSDRKVNSIQGTRTVKGQIKQPTDNGNGYLIISLNKDGRRKNFYVHRLVAEAFLEKGPEDTVVNHKDYNTKNNNVDNLEWCTTKENVLYSADRMKHPKKAFQPSAKTGEKYVRYRKERQRYVVKYSGKSYGSFAELEDAVKRRDEVLHGIDITR